MYLYHLALLLLGREHGHIYIIVKKYNSIKNVLKELNSEDATSIIKVKESIDSQNLKFNLIYIKS